MGITERKEREKAEMRETILNAAREIVSSSGVDGISIRKIAGMIEYSPAIIYHYFKNKEEIIEILIEENYHKILAALSSFNTSDITPAEKLRESSKSFIMLAVQMEDAYKSIMLNNSETVLTHTSVLQRGAAYERPAIAMLCRVLRELPGFNEKTDTQVELTAQIIWSLAFGLSLRLIVEQVDDVQRQRLIEHTADFILSALKNVTDTNMEELE
jgi:AcrR family transcriptional regulator